MNVTFHSLIDTERPKSLSRLHHLTIAGTTQSHTFTYQLPVHMRYNDCSDTEDYVNITFPPPEVIVWCGGETIKGEFGEGVSARMPVGRRGDIAFVGVGTCGVVLLGAGLIISSLLSYNRAKSKSE